MRRVFALLFIAGLGFAPLSALAMTGSVLDDHKYAWSNNVGYINFDNVNITDSLLTGYAWSTNKGWIKFNPALGGVTNDGRGNLTGSAWGEQLGWIDFGHVQIDNNGQFSGTATGDLIGTLTFNCPNYCDVATDWLYSFSHNGGGALSGAGGYPQPDTTPTTTPEPTPTEAIDQPLVVLPVDTGVLVVNTPTGPAIINVPSIRAVEPYTYILVPKQLADVSPSAVIPEDAILVSGHAFEVIIQDSNGAPVEVVRPSITVTLPIDSTITSNGTLGAYYFNPTNQVWVLIPDAAFDQTQASFQTNTPGTFAIFGQAPAASGQSAAITPPVEIVNRVTPDVTPSAVTIMPGITPVSAPSSAAGLLATVLALQHLLPLMIRGTAVIGGTGLIVAVLRFPGSGYSLWLRLIRLFSRGKYRKNPLL